MQEPCVIDLKMGRRTWDPLASAEKKTAEDGKYVKCKSTVGFCVPGFQTFHIAGDGVYKKFGKEYGKKLNENTVKDGEIKQMTSGVVIKTKNLFEQRCAFS